MIKHAILVSGLIVSFLASAAEMSFLAQLTEVPGASGYEKNVRHLVQKQWQPYMAELKIDGMGNLIGQRRDNQKGPKLLFMAHLDETGFMVESITPDGFLKVIPLGGIANSVIYAQRWTVSTPKGSVLAYSGMDSPHLLGDKKMLGSPDINALFLDIGAENKEQAQKEFAIQPGLEVTPVSEFSQLSKNRFLGKALDDRLGLAVISDVLRAVKQQPNQLYLAATVQEEVGMRGASTVYKATHPDIAINVEVGIADDYPMLLADRKGRIGLGKGPSLFVYDKSMIPNQELINWIMELANKNNIPLQLEVEPGYGEDGSKVQASGMGVPVVNIGIPIRYAHQHAGIFDKRDYDNTVKLLSLIAENLNQEVVDKIKKS
ncbi:TPA: M42 family metallopeptidase [Legionella pneumophila]|uniref:M42 family metallopeptidase n=1 Tax=Legionella pneumophila TaxID=446 RepID=UPI0001E3C9E9|nr:M42 family metallopeptidase [Legionella pneumophila]MDC8030421.1 1,3-beta-glucanase [Legionella pneumophila subsp. pneumophila]MDW8870582.1 M42 family metallopeptidase [Legionella pneumophila]MDW8916554.1 M42 family metallopeptidase [Legionella pneumophila]MDW8926062.1 M42 family metallopeptidase [Legionella pneumophila]MDW8932137.1 M42 family metallopeptidase [Legionella pneumophila]